MYEIRRKFGCYRANGLTGRYVMKRSMKQQDKKILPRPGAKAPPESSAASSGSELASTFADRLRTLIRDQSVSAFARKCGVKEGSIRHYLNGAKPRSDNLMKIANANGVTTDWLAAGKGPAPDFSKDSVERTLDAHFESAWLEMLLEAIEDAHQETGRALTSSQKARIISVASRIAARMNEGDRRSWIRNMTFALIDLLSAPPA